MLGWILSGILSFSYLGAMPFFWLAGRAYEKRMGQKEEKEKI